MGRRPRLPSATGYYHVVSRGNRRQAVFKGPEDYAAYCNLVQAICQAQSLILSHFCLMPHEFREFREFRCHIT